MSQPFSAEQSREIDDRIVGMLVAALGEGPAVRHARAIANERYLEMETTEDVPSVDPRVSLEAEAASARRGRSVQRRG